MAVGIVLLIPAGEMELFRGPHGTADVFGCDGRGSSFGISVVVGKAVYWPGGRTEGCEMSQRIGMDR
jgi:hypothetical protein